MNFIFQDLLRTSQSDSCSKELKEALDCMLIVLKCVNDSMLQIAITGFPVSITINYIKLTNYYH